jgi:translation initiation factor 1
MSNKNKNKNGLVYSTNPSANIPESGRTEQETLPPNQQQLKVFIDKKQRAGKKVTLITGVGGTVKNGEILIQGDFRNKIIELLTGLGYKAKAAGG